MSFDILNKLFPKDAPDVSDFFAHDPLHGFTVSIVLGLTNESHYVKAYEKFVAEHWKPGEVQKVVTPVVETTKPVVSLKK
jgi:hypothetical protein